MLAFDAATALVVVDVQNDFADPGGTLSVAGGDGIIPFVNGQIAAAVAAGAFVAYTQDWHPGHTPHFAPDGGIWPVHRVMDTWGAALHPALHVTGPVVRKGSGGEDGYSGFTMRDPATGATIPTELPGLLRERRIERVVVCGLATDYCVVATALDAVELGFETSVLLEGICAVDLAAGDGDRAVGLMRTAGVQVIDRVDAGGTGGRSLGRVVVENVNHPGRTTTADAAMYEGMRDALLAVLPDAAPGLTQAAFGEAVLPLLPADLFPGGAKAGWWAKTVQLDLEAKGVLVREPTSPLRWHRVRA